MGDSVIARTAAIGLALLALLVVGGGILLAHSGRALPDSLVAIGAVAAGALAALLARPNT